MTGLGPRSVTALAPVRGSLFAAARREAADIRGGAVQQALALVAAARGNADQIRSAAAEEGSVTAHARAVVRSARVRREAHETVLMARNVLWLALQRQVRESAAECRNDPRYPRLLASLIQQSHALLGPEATVLESPEGGVIAEAGSCRLDLSLPVLATRTLKSMIREVSALWTD